jgi:type IV pilus assembly protein PilV
MCRLRKNSGLTLIEVMIAIAIIAIGIFGVMSLVITVMKGNTLSKRVTTASTIAQERMEDIKREDYDMVFDAFGTDSTTYDIDYYWEVDVFPDTPPATDTKTITVDVYWDPPASSSAHKVEIKSIIAQ